MRARLPLLLCAGALGAAGLAACGVEVSEQDKRVRDPTRPPGEPAAGRATLRPAARPAGIVDVDGSTQGSLTQEAVRRAGPGADIRTGSSGADVALNRLCRGQVDIADTSRTITAREARVCQRYGLSFVQLLIASDAVVAATKNEADVGGDCLAVAEVRRIFGRGSDIDNWRQVGFFDLPVVTTGPDERSNAFDFFAQQVLGRGSRATLTDFRREYRARPTDRDARLLVVNERRLIAARGVARRRIRAANQRDKGPLGRMIGRAEQRAADGVVRQIERENAQRKRRKQSVASPEGLVRQNARRVNRAKRGARLKMLDSYRRRKEVRDDRITTALVERADRPGTVGLFRFSYYENFEDQLRPMEVDLGVTRRQNCIFPSQQTVTDGTYPLARRLLLYTTTRSLRRPEVKQFLNGYVNRAQALALAARLVPLPEPQRQQQLQIIEAGGVREAQARRRAPQPRPQPSTTTTPGAPPPSAGATGTTPGAPRRTAPAPAAPTTPSAPGATSTTGGSPAP